MVSSIVLLFFIAVVLPYFSIQSEILSHSTFSPDTAFFYTVTEFYQAMEWYGQDGRNAYILLRWTFDVVWPIVYTSFLVSASGALTKTKSRKTQLLVLSLPILSVFFDFFENILASINVGIYPIQIEFLVIFLEGISLLKWFFIGLTAFVLMYLLIQRFIAKKQVKHD